MKIQTIAQLRVESKAELHEKLNAAVKTAVESCSDKARGILVTRDSFDRFSVALSPDVPFGQIQERDHARRN